MSEHKIWLELHHEGPNRDDADATFSRKGFIDFIHQIQTKIAEIVGKETEGASKAGRPLPKDMGVYVEVVFGADEVRKREESIPNAVDVSMN